jgi:lysophospholipase L1-like esterase
MKRLLPLLIAFFVLPVALRPGESSGAPAAFTTSQRVVFLGDSITYAGTYVDFIEAAVRLHDPAWHGEILDLGLPSETASGLSEPGHAGGRFLRPDLHERLDRVLAQTKPDLVVACYGMNDGVYYPFAEDRFSKFRDGIEWLRGKVAASHATIIHVTPPVFDPEPVKEKVLPAGLTAYPKPYQDYNDVLDRYSAWLIAQRAQGWDVIDAHTPMNAELAVRRHEKPGFFFAKDGVHPDRLGHAIIARAILQAWKFPAELADAPMRWAGEPESELLKLIRTRRKLLSDAWLTDTGHKRPGLTKGLPLTEANRQAAEIEVKIRTLVPTR